MSKNYLKEFIEKMIKDANSRKLKVTSACQKSWLQGYIHGLEQTLETIEQGE